MKSAKKLPLAVTLVIVAAVALAGYLAWKIFSIAMFGVPGGSSTKPPNLLFISLDTCRADRLSAYGYERETSPSLARVGEDGSVFTNAFTVATYSAPTHATMFTGLYPLQHGLVDNGLELSEEVTPLAEILREIGYSTAAFVGYYVLGDETGLHRGFDTFQLDQIESHKHDRKSMAREVAGFRAAKLWLQSWYYGSRVDDEADHDREPFFLWFHAQQIHQSYDPPEPYDSLYLDVPFDVEVEGFDEFELRCSNDVRKALKRGLMTDEMKAQVEALYDGEIRLVDDELAKLFEFLREAELYDDTVIVVVADHGEHLFEETEIDFGRGGFRHSRVYFDTVLRIPLIIKPAGATTGNGGRPGVTTSMVDLFPTMLELLGLDMSLTLPGRSLVPWIEDPERPDELDTIFFQERPKGDRMGLRTSEWKFVRKQLDDETERWLIDLRTDPEERQDVYWDHPEVARQLEERLDDWLSQQEAVTPSSLEDMSERMRQALRDAGYLRDAETDGSGEVD